MWRITLAVLADACADLDYMDGAEVLLEELIPHAEFNASSANSVEYGSVARFVGRLCTMLERWDEAEQHFEIAFTAHDRMGLSLDRVDAARLRRDASPPQRARRP